MITDDNMALFKQLCLLWTILCAVCVSCQELTSTLREGNHACQGEEIDFTCITKKSTLSIFAIEWTSPEYISGSLQFSTESLRGANTVSTIDGRVTAYAIVTRNSNDNGVHILESMLRITATEVSTVTCSSTTGDSANIKFDVSEVPGVPQMISAAETSQPVGTTCIILVQWDPPANSNGSDIDQYIVYVPLRNIEMTISSLLTNLTVMNCGDDIRIQVAAVNRIGCVGMNSSEVQLILLDIPTASTVDGSAITEGGSSGQLGAGAIAGIIIASIIIPLLSMVFTVFFCYCLPRYTCNVAPDASESHELLKAKECYQQQSKHDIGDLGSEKDRVCVPFWIDNELDDSWKDSLHKAVQAINEAAPGLSLSIAKDKEQAIIHALAIDKKEAHTEGDIRMRLTSGQTDYITKIYLGQLEDDTKEGISIRELFLALGFHQANNLGLTCFDPSSISLYQSKTTCESVRRRFPVWWLIKSSVKMNIKLSELDKVSLNLVYPPCRDTSATDNGYRPKLGKNGMCYCGRSVMSGHTYPGDNYPDGVCGPDDGPNCPACRTIKNPKVDEILEKGKWQGMTGLVYCGRRFTKEHRGHDGICGINNGPACSKCNTLLNKN